MKLLIWIGFGACGWCVLGILICAAMGSFFWAMVCFFAAALLFFISYREADALEEDSRWQDAYQHPRI